MGDLNQKAGCPDEASEEAKEVKKNLIGKTLNYINVRYFQKTRQIIVFLTIFLRLEASDWLLSQVNQSNAS